MARPTRIAFRRSVQSRLISRTVSPRESTSRSVHQRLSHLRPCRTSAGGRRASPRVLEKDFALQPTARRLPSCRGRWRAPADSEMDATTFGLERPEGVVLFVYRWLPDGPAKAVVQIAHGWGEHAGRYARAAEALCREGFAVYANDHRGHGHTARTSADL